MPIVSSFFFTQMEITIGDEEVETLGKMATLFQKWSQQSDEKNITEQKSEEAIEKKVNEILEKKLAEMIPKKQSSPLDQIIPKVCKYS